MNLSFRFPLALGALLFGLGPAGCDDNSSDAPAGQEDPQRGVGKADQTGSCFDDGEALCGGSGVGGGCWCDSQCVEFGDCCGDIEAACGTDEPECAPGTVGTNDGGCNTCTCEDDGTWSCTEIDCGGDTTCEPGDVDESDPCNLCFCGADGEWSCTELACGGVCEPGDVIDADDGCNTCTCDDSGNWSCTELGCGGDECSPGTVSNADDGCNTCTCDDDGTWSCTELDCGNAECEPGEVEDADDACNVCFCETDGTWSCTEFACE